MELNKTKNWFYVITVFAILFLIVLGGWWLWLVFQLSNKVSELQMSVVDSRLSDMVKWEGITFFSLLIGLGGALLYFHFQDHKKTKSLQAFFSSLTHELKTPIASMKLQSQVLSEMLDDITISDEDRFNIKKYSTRLQEDSTRLEFEFDKHLQLSRVERGAPLNMSNVHLIPFLNKEFSKYPELQYDIRYQHDQEEICVLADEYSFSMVTRNLIENTLRHQDDSVKSVDINITETKDRVQIEYDDHGDKFPGELASLGKLFYKYKSPKGSGIGLYLAKKLIHQMKGQFKISNNTRLIFDITLNKGHTDE